MNRPSLFFYFNFYFMVFLSTLKIHVCARYVVRGAGVNILKTRVTFIANDSLLLINKIYTLYSSPGTILML